MTLLLAIAMVWIGNDHGRETDHAELCHGRRATATDPYVRDCIYLGHLFRVLDTVIVVCGF
jgi:hypothetical protein